MAEQAPRGVLKRKQALLLARRKRIKARKLTVPRREEIAGSPEEFPREEKAVRKFREWCDHVTLDIHPKLYIGRHYSCHEIGVVAKAIIHPGEVLARIPRAALLTASTCNLGNQIRSCRKIMSCENSWIPLLIALIGEYALKGRSYWQPYLELVPNNEGGSPPPILWEETERERLLADTGLHYLIQQDLVRLKEDYRSLVEPFLQHCVEKSQYSEQLYTQAAAFVMSYSFTDNDSNSLLSQTIMVPFADLLNHHTNHHARLVFRKNTLELLAVRTIRQGEEVMNSFGQLPNYSLLHTHGFVEINNPIDKACVPLCHLREAYLSTETNLNWKRRRWAELMKNEVLDDFYEVDTEGIPETDMLKAIQLLTGDNHTDHVNISLASLTGEQLNLLRRYIENCIAHLPKPAEEVSAKEKHTNLLFKQHLSYLNQLLYNIIIMQNK